MRAKSLIYPSLLAVFVGATLVSCATEKKSAAEATARADSGTVSLHGKLVPPENTDSSLKFKTESDQVYTLVSNRMSSALFIDTNLQARTLLLKGRVLPGKKFEVTGNLHSIHDGKVHELYYYCDICAIKGIDPGPCMCCREPVVLVEEPAPYFKGPVPKPR